MPRPTAVDDPLGSAFPRACPATGEPPQRRHLLWVAAGHDPRLGEVVTQILGPDWATTAEPPGDLPVTSYLIRVHAPRPNRLAVSAYLPFDLSAATSTAPPDIAEPLLAAAAAVTLLIVRDLLPRHDRALRRHGC